MRYFKSRLASNEEGFVGRWCIHTRQTRLWWRSSTRNNEELFLRTVSTYFLSKRAHSNTTFMDIQQRTEPSQIDYILVSSRWTTSARDCKTLPSYNSAWKKIRSYPAFHESISRYDWSATKEGHATISLLFVTTSLRTTTTKLLTPISINQCHQTLLLESSVA